MRGKGADVQGGVTMFGITPAYAGKSRSGCAQSKHGTGSPPPMRGKVTHRLNFFAFGRDHPRLCGEKNHFIHLPIVPPGSPPPMRGKAGVVHVHKHFIRITPAYAGKSGMH